VKAPPSEDAEVLISTGRATLAICRASRQGDGERLKEQSAFRLKGFKEGTRTFFNDPKRVGKCSTRSPEREKKGRDWGFVKDETELAGGTSRKSLAESEGGGKGGPQQSLA